MITTDFLFENIDRDIQNLRTKCSDYESQIVEQSKTIDNLKIQLFEVLKQMVGHKIYWAHKDWSRYETHIISKVEIGIVTTDFFGDAYIKKECIKIYVEDGGFYISEQLNNTLFFDEQEAQTHVSKN